MSGYPDGATSDDFDAMFANDDDGLRFPEECEGEACPGCDECWHQGPEVGPELDDSDIPF